MYHYNITHAIYIHLVVLCLSIELGESSQVFEVVGRIEHFQKEFKSFFLIVGENLPSSLFVFQRVVCTGFSGVGT